MAYFKIPQMCVEVRQLSCYSNSSIGLLVVGQQVIQYDFCYSCTSPFLLNAFQKVLFASLPTIHCKKYRNFTNFLVWKFCRRAQSRRPKPYGNCAFPQNSTPGNQVKLRNFSQWLLDALTITNLRHAARTI